MEIVNCKTSSLTNTLTGHARAIKFGNFLNSVEI